MNWPGPGNVCDPVPISLEYPIAGNYDICIEGFNDSTYGCISDTFCCNITVLSSTVSSSFFPSDTSGCQYEYFDFTNTSTCDPGNQTSWCFDMNITTNPPSPNLGSGWETPYACIPLEIKSHQFMDAGCYYVGLWTQNPLMDNTYIYEDANGPIPFIVHPTPNTNFIPIDFCVGVQDTLFDNSGFPEARLEPLWSSSEIIVVTAEFA